MKNLLILLLLLPLFQCTSREPETDIIYTDVKPDEQITANLSGNNRGQVLAFGESMVLSGFEIDLNRDQFSDFGVYISRTKADGIHYLKDANYIYLRPLRQVAQMMNSFELLISVDKSISLNNAPRFFSGMARLYKYNEEMNSDFGFVEDYYVYKDDYDDSYQRTGNHYIGVQMVKGEDIYYGWIQLEVNDFSVTVKDYAFCKTPGKKIKAGVIQ